jgi:hypothetical protein
MIAAYHLIHFLLDAATGARRLLLLLLWTLLHLFVYYCPCLYWRAGAEMKSGDMCNGGYSGTGGCKEDPTTWKRYPVTYRNIAEHHGLVDPKVCRFPSFTKVYGTAAHYAEEDKSLRRVHLVFLLRGGTYTKRILEDDMLFNDMLHQCNYVIKSPRSDNLSWACDYALNFA